MNDYEARIEARRARYEERAEKATTASGAAFAASRRATAGIELGQPILVGHHSERRHRKDLARSDSAMRKSCEQMDKARHYEQKAAAVGTGGVSSDDPEALAKLRKQLAEREAAQERMKAANKVAKGSKPQDEKAAALIAQGFAPGAAEELIKSKGFPSYSLTNNNAQVRRLRERIAELEARRSREAVEIEGESYSYREDTEENRVAFEFQGKPAQEVRELLKAHAFKWSPSRGAWVRQLSAAGIKAGASVRAALEQMEKNA